MVDAVEWAAEALHYRFQRSELLHDALTHASVMSTGRVLQIERLEFLGDAVVGLAVTDLLMRTWPAASEGTLTMARARLVSTAALARKTRQIGLAEVVILGRGEEKTGGREKPSILAAVFEAVLGAVFLDGGFDAARRVTEHVFRQEAEKVSTGDEDPKTGLQEMTQRLFKQLPTYVTLRAEGPNHARDFVVEVSVARRVLGRGVGRSKRAAAQEAAREALAVLKSEEGGHEPPVGFSA